MPGEPLYPIVVEKLVTPEGAYEHAAQFRAAAALYREVARELYAERSNLDEHWKRMSHSRFMGEFQPMPSDLEDMAHTLEERATDIEHKLVVVRETIWVTKDRIS